MRIAQVLLAIFFFAAIASIGDAPAAEAGDCWCNDGYVGGIGARGVRRLAGCSSRSRYFRAPCHPSTRVLAPRHLGRFGGYGGGVGFG